MNLDEFLSGLLLPGGWRLTKHQFTRLIHPIAGGAGESLSLDIIQFGIADGAAAPSTAAAIPPAGVPDVADLTGYVMPAGGYIVGGSMSAGNASGDTCFASPTLDGTQNTALTMTCTNAAKTTAVSLTQATAIQFGTANVLGVKYKTTTGGTYTVTDIGVALLLGIALGNIPVLFG